jgi:peptidoglycan/xylan/chitin deacetylase (PgdA/CDA1 family)
MAASELTRRWRRDSVIRAPGVPVLMYHGLFRRRYTGDASLAKYSVSLSRFTEQLTQIRESGCRVVSLQELRSNPQDVLTVHSVAITFDDGQASDYEIALPSLVKHGFCADFFINTSTIGREGFLTWQQIVAMHSAGMGIHSHSHDHVVLSHLSGPTLKSQLLRSKELLENHIGGAVEFLSVPYGFINRRVVDTAQEVGYKAICHSVSWPARAGASLIPRIAVYADASPSEFVSLLFGEPWPYLKRALRASISYVPKRLLLRYSPRRLGVRVLEGHA